MIHISHIHDCDNMNHLERFQTQLKTSSDDGVPVRSASVMLGVAT